MLFFALMATVCFFERKATATASKKYKPSDRSGLARKTDPLQLHQ